MPDTLSSYAQSQPDKLGVIDDKPDGTVVTWTYAELEAQSNRVANLLLRLGAGPGKKVLWCGPNSPEVVAVMTATRRIGAVAVPLNYRLTPEEALYVINHSDAEVAYVDYEHAPMFAGLRDRLEKVRHIVAVGGPAPDGMLTDADIAAAPAGAPDVGDAAGTGGTMIYTSGTTGKPKGAVRAAGPDPELLGALLNLFGYRPDDIYITSGPLYHSGPSAFMGAGLLYGQTIIVQRRFDAEDWLRLVDKYKASSTFSAPALIRMVCALRREVKDRYDRSSASTPCCCPRTRCASRDPAASRLPASRSCWSTPTATRSPVRDRTIPARFSCGPKVRSTPTTRTTPAMRRAAAGISIPSATSPTGTTRATSTSATARPT